MTDISIKQIDEITPFWVFYVKEDGEPGNIQLSACANNFAIHRGSGSGDGCRCVGLRYEKDGFGYYELFNVGHTRIKCPLKPNALRNLLGGRKAAEKLRQQYEALEARLNQFGWKTAEESN